MTETWPTELRLGKDKKVLTISFENGERFELLGCSDQQRRYIAAVTYGERDLRAQQVDASVSEPVGRSRLCDPQQP